jgi:1,4-dihydroxy-2-naphthoyl-CoA hydrolase
MDSMPKLDRPPRRFMQATGLVLDDVQSSHVTGWINLGPEHHQPWGLVHGGVYTTAIESAASVGASTAARERGLVAVGVNNNTNFLRSMTEGRVTVDARAIQQGRSQQLWEVRITDDRDRLVAIGQVRLQNISPRA